MSVISANVIVCQDLLTDKSTDLQSAIRMLSVLTIPTDQYAHFYTLASVFGSPGDFSTHVLSVRLETPEGVDVVGAPGHMFQYGYREDPSGYGGYNLTTKFGLELNQLPSLGWFLIQVYVDRLRVASAPLMLRR